MIQPIHPFPARMAPEISRSLLRELPQGSRILDPMCGSGTVVRQAVEAGHFCVGRDLDPLAVLMTRACTTATPIFRLVHDAHDVVERAQTLDASELVLPWDDSETDEFVRYWFAEPQISALARLAQVLKGTRYQTRDLLPVCFSRLIITKDRGASLARDVSHSRPHRVMTSNDFDVYVGFVRAARLAAKRLSPELLQGTAGVDVGDAREIDAIGVFDAVMTSPPYLNAIDYMRGHRLTLVWFGHSLGELQKVRRGSTGSERRKTDSPFEVEPFVRAAGATALHDRYMGWIRRYATDMTNVLTGCGQSFGPAAKLSWWWATP